IAISSLHAMQPRCQCKARAETGRSLRRGVRLCQGWHERGGTGTAACAISPIPVALVALLRRADERRGRERNMMRLDSRGLEVSCEGDDDLAASEDFSRRLLRLATGTEAILAAAARFPETPLLQLQAASAYLFGQTAADDARAGELLARAATL